ncbi:MAG: PhoH family protein [Candidatus Nitrotoga sp.]|nr:PhoH family protein [Candidatus Nitrotoga sp.]MDO9447984.1 PhoH family protein [Candidatus Nitrotoga sp.]MDP3496142.1 PhoH family protein [Candidatus Nitrotoga sp.]RFC40137.1 MAG: PhoH-like ATPase [Candidatus Nitrotoga sp. CP45]
MPSHKTSAANHITKLFVLDTNVLMHDPTSLFRFEEHDIYLPIFVLEELDNNKKGMTEVARNARQASRFLDSLVSESTHNIDAGVPLQTSSNKGATGRLFLQTQFINNELPANMAIGKADNAILGVVMFLYKQQPKRSVILVSKDINMRIKARALGLDAQDYFNDKVLEDTDLLYSGVLALPQDFWDKHGKDMKSGPQGEHTFYNIQGPLCRDMLLNQFVYQENGSNPFYAVVTEQNDNTAMLRTLTDYTHTKNAIWGITARNREQSFVLNLLMNPEIDFVTLLGQAGTGKTLLTLAAGLVQMLEHKLYSEIIMTRVTVPVGEDIGFLPGTEEEKMSPWMGALDDNLDVLNKPNDESGEWGRAATRDLIRSRIKIKSLNFMRGRTFLNKYLIIDEAQNLTPKQMKTLITRAGPGTKVVCMGNIAQIDTPYLTEGSSGLTYVVDRFKGWQHSGHVTLQRGERSRLADHAGEVL